MTIYVIDQGLMKVTFDRLNKKSKRDGLKVSGIFNLIRELNISDSFRNQPSATIVFNKANASNFRSD